MNVIGFNEHGKGLLKNLFLYLREEGMTQSGLGSAATLYMCSVRVNCCEQEWLPCAETKLVTSGKH